MFRIIVMLIVGLIAGALARLLLPGKDPMSVWMTILLGIAGSFVGGFIGSLIWRPEDGSYFHPGGIVLSVVGAVLLLWIWRMIQKRRTA